MTAATTKAGWLLETGQRADGWTAWVSDAHRYVVGFGRGDTSVDAVRNALTDAAHHYRKDLEQSAALELLESGGFPERIISARAGPIGARPVLRNMLG